MAAISILVAGGWYGFPWLQKARADWRLDGANNHIVRANQLLSETQMSDLSLASFTSQEKIRSGGEIAQAALPLLRQARTETEQAENDMRSARGLAVIPAWYREYLDKKEQIAAARLEQLGVLEQTALSLEGLYQSGTLIFMAIETMDRLLGQYQAATGILPNDPAQAKTQLDQVAESMRQIQAQMNAAYTELNFQLLADLADIAADNAELVEISAQLAEATAAGDQVLAQQLAALVDDKQREAGIGSDLLGHWWNQEISPLEEQFKSLQSRQQVLDAEAAAVFGQEIGALNTFRLWSARPRAPANRLAETEFRNTL